jgi:hypothetical protein|eukprot:COSAG01_NODE_424_length_17253_cov_31.601900_24_plen_50_part_00
MLQISRPPGSPLSVPTQPTGELMTPEPPKPTACVWFRIRRLIVGPTSPP